MPDPPESRSPIEQLALVASRLGDAVREFVFVGGAAAGLYLEEAGSAPPRPTKDVDAIVRCDSYSEYHTFGQRILVPAGFCPDVADGAPICRWRLGEHAILFDVMPTHPKALGLEGRWFAGAFESAVQVALGPGLMVRIPGAPYFIAMKLEAFSDRGRGDFLASHDLEDFVTIVDSRGTLPSEVEASPDDLRTFLQEQIGRLLGDRRFRDAVPAHLPPDAASQARAEIILDRLVMIARRQ